MRGDIIRAAAASVGAPVSRMVATPDVIAAGAATALLEAPTGLTVEGAAAFMATCTQESAYFRALTELGDLRDADYYPYIGRTFTQITWEANYRKFGEWCVKRGLILNADYFVKNPAALGDFRWAWLGPMQYWEQNGIWRWANAGQFREVSQAINGGNKRAGTSFTPHGWKERQAMYAAYLKFGDELLPDRSAKAMDGRQARQTKLMEDLMIDRVLSPGRNIGTIICPVGTASELVSRGWVSVRADGGAKGTVWFQDSANQDGPAPGAGKPMVVDVKNAGRQWHEVWNGTEYLQYDITTGGHGALLVELEAK